MRCAVLYSALVPTNCREASARVPQQRSRAGANVESGQHGQNLACQCIIEVSQLSALALQCGRSEQSLQLESPSVQPAKGRYIEVASKLPQS